MKISLADAEASVASARAKLAGLEAQQRRAEGAGAARAAGRGGVSRSSIRDYDVQKKTYESLLDAARIGDDGQGRAGHGRRAVPRHRSAARFAAAGRAEPAGAARDLASRSAVAAGLFASLAASQLMPTFHDARALREISKRPILGMVSMLPSEALHRAAQAQFLAVRGRPRRPVCGIRRGIRVCAADRAGRMRHQR